MTNSWSEILPSDPGCLQWLCIFILTALTQIIVSWKKYEIMTQFLPGFQNYSLGYSWFRSCASLTGMASAYVPRGVTCKAYKEGWHGGLTSLNKSSQHLLQGCLFWQEGTGRVKCLGNYAWLEGLPKTILFLWVVLSSLHCLKLTKLV